MAIPLVQTGPGGVYTTRYLPRARRLLALMGSEDGASSDQGHQASLATTPTPLVPPDATIKPAPTLLARLLGIDEVQISPEAQAADQNRPRPTPTPTRDESSSALEAARSWLAGQSVMLRQVSDTLERLTERIRPFPAPALVDPTVATTRWTNRFLATPRPAPTSAGVNYFQETRLESHPEAIAYSSTDPRLASHPRLFADHAGTRRRTRHQQGHRVRARRGVDQKGRALARAEQGTLFVHL